jgi:site-specific recombinase XerD
MERRASRASGQNPTGIGGFSSWPATAAAITPGDADAFRLALLGRGLSDNTVRRFCGRARQYFRAAIRRELVTRNPFDGIAGRSPGNEKPHDL